jgi:hypothetical protein
VAVEHDLARREGLRERLDGPSVVRSADTRAVLVAEEAEICDHLGLLDVPLGVHVHTGARVEVQFRRRVGPVLLGE